MDYIDIYKKNYREAYERNFSKQEDKDISKEFYKNARKDIEWGKEKGLIKEMCMQDYIQSMTKDVGRITDRVRKIVIEAKFIPVTLLADHFGIHPSTISKIRTQHKYEQLEQAK